MSAHRRYMDDMIGPPPRRPSAIMAPIRPKMPAEAPMDKYGVQNVLATKPQALETR